MLPYSFVKQNICAFWNLGLRFAYRPGRGGRCVFFRGKASRLLRSGVRPDDGLLHVPDDDVPYYSHPKTSVLHDGASIRSDAHTLLSVDLRPVHYHQNARRSHGHSRIRRTLITMDRTTTTASSTDTADATLTTLRA